MLTADPPNTTRLPNQQKDVLTGSPTAILAIFTEIIRERFRPDNALAWVWDGSPTPKADATNTPGSPRKILIEPAYSETAEVRNYRPAIYVDRGPTQAGKVALGNFVGQHLPSGLAAYYAMAQVPINILIEASRKGESTALADAVWFYLLAGVNQIRETFDFQDISTPQLGSTGAIEKDKAGWVTPVSFVVTLNLRWSVKPISPILKEIRQRVNTGTELLLVSAPR